MKSAIASLVCGTVLLVGSPVTFAEDVAQSKELIVLDRLVGTWDWEVIAKPAEWTPQEVKTSGTLKREWVLNGRFVHEVGGNADQPSMCLWTYDAEKRLYRLWHFSSEGKATEHDGTWDGSAKAMTWKTDLGNGVTTTGTSVFTDKDTDEWKMVAKDKEGKVYLNLEGKNKRTK